MGNVVPQDKLPTSLRSSGNVVPAEKLPNNLTTGGVPVPAQKLPDNIKKDAFIPPPQKRYEENVPQWLANLDQRLSDFSHNIEYNWKLKDYADRAENPIAGLLLSIPQGLHNVPGRFGKAIFSGYGQEF